MKKEFNIAVTLFFQEILHFCQLSGGSQAVIPELFEFHGNQMHFISKPYHSLSFELTAHADKLKYEVKNLLNSLCLEMEYFVTQKAFEKLNFDLQNVFHLEGTDTFFLGDWAMSARQNNVLDSVLRVTNTSVKNDRKTIVSEGIYSLGGLALVVSSGIDPKEPEDLKAIKNDRHYNLVLEDMLEKIDVNTETKALLRKMLDKDPTQRITFNELLKKMESFGDNSKISNIPNKTAKEIPKQHPLLSKSIEFRLRFPMEGRYIKFDLDESDSFKEVVLIAEEELGIKEDELEFYIAIDSRLKYKTHDDNYWLVRDIYLQGKGVGWRDGEAATLTVSRVYFG